MENLVNPAELVAFRGKKVFITGHTGFKGAWLFYWLQQLGAVVKGYALAPVTTPSLFTALYPDGHPDSIIADINDLQLLSETINSFQPDFLFHLAAQPLVRESYKTPVETFYTNVVGTANVLEALRRLDKKCTAVLITTDKVYENREWIYPYRENDRLGGYDPYSASKACSEIVIASFRNSFYNTNKFNDHRKSIASTRAGNVIGGGDWSADRLVPDIAKALSADQPVIVRNPDAVRPWQHVMEPLFGYMSVALKMDMTADGHSRFGSAWNFGPSVDDNYPVKYLVQDAIQAWGSGEVQYNIDPSAPHEARLLKLDISKVTNELGWRPRMNAKTAVERTIQWYKNFYKGASAAELLNTDLSFYQSLFI